MITHEEFIVIHTLHKQGKNIREIHRLMGFDRRTMQECHLKAFSYFGRVPETILYDNLKSVVIQRDKYDINNQSFNKEFLEL